MIYLMLLCGFILLFCLFCFVVIMRKRMSRQMLLGICIFTFVISALFPMRYVLCNPFFKEQVSITALREKNEASLGTDIVIQYIDSNFSERKLENPVEGKWAWLNGNYRWSEAWEQQGLQPTDTIVMEAPVGYERSITFANGPGYGKAEITCLGKSQTVDLYSEQEGTYLVRLPASSHDDYDKLLRAAAFGAAVILLITVTAMVTVFINRKTNWRVLLKWKYEALVFLISLLNIVLVGRYPNAYAYSLTYYFLPYERGFGSRGLLGTLTSILGGSYVSYKGLTGYILMALALAYLFFSILVVRQAKKEPDKWTGVFWILLYLLTPLTFMDAFDDTRDLYLIILFLIGVMIINKNRFVQLIPAICVFMILLNETSSVFFVAPLLALLLYFFVKEKDKGYLFSFLSSAVFTCVITLGIMFLDKEKLIPIENYFTHMSMHTDAALDYNAFRAEYRTSNETIKDYAFWMGSQIPYFHNHELMITSILYFVLIIPFIILFAILWKAIYFALLENALCKKTAGQHESRVTPLLLTKLSYWIMLLSSCGGVICMLMAWDYLRFTKLIMIAMLASMFTLINKEKITLSIRNMYLFSPPKRGYPLLPFSILLYMNSWGVVACWGPDTQLLIDLTHILRDFMHIK